MAAFLGLSYNYRRFKHHLAEYAEPVYTHLLELKLKASEVKC